MKHVGMSQNARRAMRNEATRRWKPPKVTAFAELTISTAIWPARGRLRTVANGCERLQTVADGWQRLVNAAQPPDPQSETRTLATHSGKNWQHVETLSLSDSLDLEPHRNTREPHSPESGGFAGVPPLATLAPGVSALSLCSSLHPAGMAVSVPECPNWCSMTTPKGLKRTQKQRHCSAE